MLSPGKFSLVSLNVRSLKNKFEDITSFIHECNTPDNSSLSVLALQEIWNVPNPDYFNIDGYSPLAYKIRDPTGNSPNIGGGVGLFVSINYEFEILEDLSIFEAHTYESIFVKIFLGGGGYIIVGNVYRPNTGNLASVPACTKHITKVLETISSSSNLNKAKNLIVTGDFNIDLLKANGNKHYSNFTDSIIAAGLLPLITHPTRFAGLSASLLDLICCSKTDNDYKAGIIVSSVSDHLPVFLIHDVPAPPTKEKFIKTRVYSEENKNAFVEQVRAANWDIFFLSSYPDECTEIFVNRLTECHETAFPMKIIKPNKKFNPLQPWMSTGILTSRKAKEKLFNKKLKDPTYTNIESFRDYNNSYKKICRASKHKYFRERFEGATKNIRETWVIVKEVMGTAKKFGNYPSYFNYKGSKLKSNEEIANGFNDFFCGIGENLAKKIPSPDKSYEAFLGNRSKSRFKFRSLSNDEVYRILQSLKPKSSSGRDMLSSKMLKFLGNLIVPHLTKLINLSLAKGVVPRILKIAKVIPIFKSGDRRDFTNYRPISLLPSISKILEKAAAYQLIDYLNNNNLLYKLQFGFRAGHGTLHPLIVLVDKIIEAHNKGMHVMSVFIDLKKAFDTVCHSILLDKLKFYGVTGLANAWFGSYLRDRSQYTFIDGTDSTTSGVNIGVPQGSVLGPLLFLVFINDMPNVLEFLSILFADDTSYLLCHNNLATLIEKNNIELNKADSWFRANKLTLNISKTKFMIFSPKGSFHTLDNDVKVGQEVVERIGSQCKTKSFKLVGVLLDDKLNWSHQVDLVKKKLASCSYALRGLKSLLPTNIKLLMYNSLFRSHLDYGLPIWGGATASTLKGINVMHKKVIRNINSSGYNAHTEPILLKLGLLTLSDLHQLCLGTFAFQYRQKKHPTYIMDQLDKVKYNTRSHQFTIEKQKYAYFKNQTPYLLVNTWNNINIAHKNLLDIKDEELKTDKSRLAAFKTSLKAQFSKNYQSRVKCSNKFCTDCQKVPSTHLTQFEL